MVLNSLPSRSDNSNLDINFVHGPTAVVQTAVRELQPSTPTPGYPHCENLDTCSFFGESQKETELWESSPPVLFDTE